MDTPHTLFSSSNGMGNRQRVNGHGTSSNRELNDKLSHNHEKLAKLMEKSTKPLIKARSIFPFDFFPDEISVDETKVTIVVREFFGAEDIHSVMIKLIKDIELEASIFFATIKIVPDGYPGKAVVIRYLKKNEALRVRRVIQGLMVSMQEGIHPAEVDDDHFVQKMEHVGAAHYVE